MRETRRAAVCAFIVLVVISSARPALSDESWRFRLSPYAWLANAKGDVGTAPGQPTVPIDVSPRDAAKNFEGGAGVGGFGVGSDLFYEISANVGYQWNESIGTAIGYRMFDVDYENGGYVYGMRQQGWQLGLTWSF